MYAWLLRTNGLAPQVIKITASRTSLSKMRVCLLEEEENSIIPENLKSKKCCDAKISITVSQTRSLQNLKNVWGRHVGQYNFSAPTWRTV